MDAFKKKLRAPFCYGVVYFFQINVLNSKSSNIRVLKDPVSNGKCERNNVAMTSFFMIPLTNNPLISYLTHCETFLYYLKKT